MPVRKPYSLFNCLASVCAFWNLIAPCGAGFVVVKSPAGKFKGVEKVDTKTGETYVSFKGIPYARPPVGELRLAKPQPHPKIDGVFDATKEERIMCPRPDPLTIGKPGFTEDCLVLNIQTRDIRETGQPLRKVLVFIHGGAFTLGSSVLYESKSFVISQDVIVVTMNYRIGALGFLSTENEASPGNYGLWDQNLALRWVKDNIRAFGGDPDDVTVAGQSAGGASIGLHVLSNHSKGLFTKAYPHSGAATSVFAFSYRAQPITLELAKSAGCWNKNINHELNVDESKRLIQCLRKRPLSVFTSFNNFSLAKYDFVPVADGEFMPDSPSKLIQDDSYLESVGFFDRDYLVGFNNHESKLYQVCLEVMKAAVFMSNELSAEEKESTWQALQTGTRQLNIQTRIGEKAASDENVINTILYFYRRRYADVSSAVAEMSTDLNFIIPPLELVRAASRKHFCNAYLLYFDYFPMFVTGPTKGTSHAIELMYWFDLEISNSVELAGFSLEGEISEEDWKLKQDFSSILGHFVRFGLERNK